MGTVHAMLLSEGNEHYGALSSAKGRPSVHTLITSNGSPYQNYQSRILHSNWQLMSERPDGRHLVAFTRVLHRTQPDFLMTEIPTFLAKPNHPECDGWCEYPVADRASAVQEFFEATKKDPGMLKADWIYMVESDYVFAVPPALPAPLAPGLRGWAYEFNYIFPEHEAVAMRKLYPESRGPLSDIPPSGPAPVLLRTEDWIKVVPDWVAFTEAIERDPETVKALGWVREMYAFSVALANQRVKVDLTPHPHSPLIVHLPGHKERGDAHAFHYTLCTIYRDKQEKVVWQYDKRFFSSDEDAWNPKPIPQPPKFQEGAWNFIEGPPVTKDVHEAIVEMVQRINEAIARLPDRTP
ncbi:hypothetical protein H632_c1552p0 [Helicosporidium sp. ATCC 50920]|nr:hypothetical protein H632_c1552p0 [Helicosporidium sp. ATCC 50920]|eukprot:KDD74122.1 hypothetical protein H632_c1552p0 [Helicosporidium sp. ATCC 50920]